jgi:hypothetical protein
MEANCVGLCALRVWEDNGYSEVESLFVVTGRITFSGLTSLESSTGGDNRPTPWITPCGL